MKRGLVLIAVLAACGRQHGDVGADAGTGGADANVMSDAPNGSGSGSGSGSGNGSGNGSGSGSGNGSGSGSGSGSGTGSGSGGGSGVITGGPCASGAMGATAVRVTWIDGQGTAYVQYDVDGTPSHSATVGAYGYEIGFTPTYDDQFLGAGGVVIDDDDFIDMQLSTVGTTTISSATLSMYGRSFDVDTDGSFNWQTFVDTGTTATDFVDNSVPYQWYSADITSAIDANDANTLIRIKAGPSSDTLVANQIELCLVAD